MTLKNKTPLEVVQGHVKFLKNQQWRQQQVLKLEGNANWSLYNIYDKLIKLMDGMTEEEFQEKTKTD